MKVDIVKPQKIVPSSPLLTVRLCHLQVDCRHQPPLLSSLCSLTRLVLPQRYLLKHRNETSVYKLDPKVQSSVWSLATVITLASGLQKRFLLRTDRAR